MTPAETATQPETAPKPEPRRRRYHLEVLVLACLVIVAAFLLQVNEDGERVAVGGAPGAVIPPTCLTYAWFGIRCPGCGLTRSFVYLAHGDLWASFRMHRLGWLVALATLVQVPYRLHEMYRPGKVQALLVAARWFGRALVALLLLNWAAELLFFR